MRMRYAGRRLLQAGFVLWLAVTLAFIAMQFVDRGTVEQIISEHGPMTWREVWRVVHGRLEVGEIRPNQPPK